MIVARHIPTRPHHYGGNIYTDAVKRIVEGKKEKHPEVRAEMAEDLKDFLDKVLMDEPCFTERVAGRITYDVVAEVGRQYSGWGIFDKIKRDLWKKVISKAMEQVVRKMAEKAGGVSNEREIVESVINPMLDEATRVKNLLKFGQWFKVGTNVVFKRHKHYGDVQDRLTAKLTPVFQRAIHDSQPFRDLTSKMLSVQIINAIGDYTHGFGVMPYNMIETIIEHLVHKIFDQVFSAGDCAVKILPKVVNYILDKLEK